METVYPKNLLFEYYNRISKPQDSDILGDWEVWVYGSDREAFPPHCHVRLKDDSFEFEVSLLNWEVINIKNSKLANNWDSIDRRVKEAFFTWLNRIAKKQGGLINKIVLYNYWNDANVQNPLEKWVDKREDIDKDLLQYLNNDIDAVWLHRTVIGVLSSIYYGDRDERERLHKMQPQELLSALGIEVDISGQEDAIEAVKSAEKKCLHLDDAKIRYEIFKKNGNNSYQSNRWALQWQINNC